MSSSPILSSSSDPSTEALAPLDPFTAMLDVVCRVEVVLGTSTITVRDCLKLQRLSVIRLTQSGGSDLELRVHGVPMASGEVVIVDDSTALRVTAVRPPPGADTAE
jgi:flagellar motor switch protein FliN/FliY